MLATLPLSPAKITNQTFETTPILSIINLDFLVKNIIVKVTNTIKVKQW